MTTLDPHDFKQDSLLVPVGTILETIETALTLAQAAALAGSVAAPPLAAAIPPLQSIKTAIGKITGFASALGVALDIPYDDFLDPDVKRWTNVAFADNYYQTKGSGAVTYTAGPLSPLSPGSLTATPNGASIDTANINRALDGLAGFTQDDFKGEIPLVVLGLPGTFSFDLGLFIRGRAAVPTGSGRWRDRPHHGRPAIVPLQRPALVLERARYRTGERHQWQPLG